MKSEICRKMLNLVFVKLEKSERLGFIERENDSYVSKIHNVILRGNFPNVKTFFKRGNNENCKCGRNWSYIVQGE